MMMLIIGDCLRTTPLYPVVQTRHKHVTSILSAILPMYNCSYHFHCHSSIMAVDYLALCDLSMCNVLFCIGNDL